jgi:GT2 family glycosyltransferase
LNQSFQNWQLCIADASNDPDVRKVLDIYAAQDPRIQVVSASSAPRNVALDNAIGDVVALLDQGDSLSEHALAHIAQTLQTTPNARLIYSDEDRLNDIGRRVDPHFKSGWNRDLFYSHNYVGGLCVLKRTLMKEIGGFRPDYEEAQNYDLLLRAIGELKDENIVHLPKVLYHRGTERGTEDHDAGKNALSEFLHQYESPEIIVEDGAAKGFYHVIWPIPAEEPKVALIIPTRDHKDLLEAAVTSILDKTNYLNYEILIVDNGSVEPETLAWFKSIQAHSSKVRLLSYDKPFNYSAINNFAVTQTDAPLIALVNNDVEVINPSWLREMVSHAIRDDIGCVGAKLHYTNGQIQHGGVIIGVGWMAGHSHKLYPGTHYGYFGRLLATQNLSALTGACLVLKRSVYEKVGGLDADNLSVAFNDIDLCLKVQALGYRNLWSPYATLFHHESISRGHEDTPEKQMRFQREAEFMVNKWQPAQNPDRYYNPNLTLDREDFSINI